ncbi:MAG: hypothetical protein ACUVWV_15435 [Thermodesulfobacteriota bacterium]
MVWPDRLMAAIGKIVHDVYPNIEINLSPGRAVANIVRISKDPNAVGTTTLLQSLQAMRASDDFEGKQPITNLRVCLPCLIPLTFSLLFVLVYPWPICRILRTRSLNYA